jgi:hypothetical protein
MFQTAICIALMQRLGPAPNSKKNYVSNKGSLAAFEKQAGCPHLYNYITF